MAFISGHIGYKGCVSAFYTQLGALHTVLLQVKPAEEEEKEEEEEEDEEEDTFIY